MPYKRCIQCESDAQVYLMEFYILILESSLGYTIYFGVGVTIMEP